MAFRTQAHVALWTLSLILACSSDKSDLSQNIPCESSSDCGSGQTCRIDTCVDNGTLVQDDTCSEDLQCGTGLICFGFQCVLGCRDIYHRDDCPEGQWCKPDTHHFVETPDGARSYIGECSPSECNPGQAGSCELGKQCTEMGPNNGACTLPCHYIFSEGSYSDNCQPVDQIPHACQVIGSNDTVACLPAGPPDGPSVNVAECDTIQHPCRPGHVCVDVVCRQLCNTSQSTPCPPGESCIRLNNASSLSFCKAD